MNNPQRTTATASDAPEVISPDDVAVTSDGPRLLVGRCRDCGALSFPAAAVCHKCWSHFIDRVEAGPQGTLYSYSTVHIGPKPWRTPYVLGYVDVTPQLRVLTHIQAADAGAIRIGSTVQLTRSDVQLEDGRAISTFVFSVLDINQVQPSEGAVHA